MSTTTRASRGATSISFPPIVGKVAIAFLLLGALTSTWTGIKFPMFGMPSDVLIVLSVAISGLLVVFGNLRFSVPLWTLAPCAAILLCLLIRQFDPEPFYLRVLRYQVQAFRPENQTKALFWLFAILIVPLAIIACTAIERRVTVWTMGAYATGATLSSVIAITDLIGLTPKIGRIVAGTNRNNSLFGYDIENMRWPGLADHPNTLACTAVLSIPVVIYFLSTMRWKWIGAIALIALFGGVLVSGSRGAQAMAPVVALAAMLWTPNRRSLTRVFSMTVFGAVVAALLLVISLPSEARRKILRLIQGFNVDRYVISSTEASDAQRFTVLKQGLTDWQSYPVFGAGIRHIPEAHNIYLQLLAAGGFVLFIAMLLYWYWILRDGWRLSRMGIVYARFLMISIGSWLVLGIVENALTDRYEYFTVGCIAGLASAYLATSRDRTPTQLGATSLVTTLPDDKERVSVGGER